jgi:hypothetical protein
MLSITHPPDEHQFLLSKIKKKSPRPAPVPEEAVKKTPRKTGV